MSDMDQDFSDATPAAGGLDNPAPEINRDQIQNLWRQREFYRNMQVARGIDGNADAAAQSQSLEATTGVPAALIAENHDEFVNQQKKIAAQGIVSANPDLDAYVMSHPLASTVSNDDWANLDKFTRQSSGGWLQKLQQGIETAQQAIHAPLAFGDQIADKALEGAEEGLASGLPVDAATRSALNPQTNTYGAIGAAAMTATFGVADIAQRIMGMVGGAITGAAGGVGGLVGGSAGEVEGRQLAGALMNQGMAEAGLHAHGAEPGEPVAAPKPATPLEAGKAWFEAGEEPPAGIHPEIDTAKAKLNDEWLGKLEEDLTNAVASTTRERSPELFESLTQRMYGDSSIGLHADAALKLYGDKPPTADDGLLGWVPNIDTQLMAARDIGSDVQIPLKDFMARVDPEVAAAIRDDIRVWPGGLTGNEAKAETALSQAREANALTLAPVANTHDADLYEDEGGVAPDSYEIRNKNNEAVGSLVLLPQEESKTLSVVWIGADGVETPQNSIGPRAIRSLIPELERLYPDYKYLTGFRSSGARNADGGLGRLVSVDDKGRTPVIGINQSSSVLGDVRAGMGTEPVEAEIGEQSGRAQAMAAEPGESISEPTPREGEGIIEGRENITPTALGMDAAHYQKYLDALDKQSDADLRTATAHAEKEQTKRQGSEWKANRAEMVKEVAPEIRQRPDIAADLFFGQGELYGKKVAGRFTLDESKLSDAQKAALPDHYVSASGVDPDQIAGVFGYSSGNEMVQALVGVEQLKTVDGKRMRGEDFVRSMIQKETDRRMEMRYGNLAASVLDAAKDQALSESSLNVQYERYRAVAESNGVTAFDKSVIKQAAHNAIQEFPLGKISSYRIMQDMGRDARNAEAALVGGKFDEAAVHLQRQTMNMYAAAEAKALEKRIGQFDKTARRMAKRDQPSMPNEYNWWIKDILQRVDKPIKMTPADLAKQLAEDSTASSLEEFVQDKADDLSALDVWEGLLDPKFKREYKSMTAEEFDHVKNAVDTLIQTGRREKKIVAQGQEFDRDQVIADLVEAVGRLPFKDIESQNQRSIITRMPRGYLTRALQVENIFGRWDKFDAWGPWTQKVFRDLKDGDNQADAWRKEYAKRLGDINDGIDLSRAIDNKLFQAPKIYGGDLLPMNRGSLRAVMLNLGNKSNIDKLTKGWQVPESSVRAFVDQHATKEDWDFAQKVWDIFGELKSKSDTMYRSMGRVAPKSVEAQEIQTPEHGNYPGGYYPVMFHRDYAKVPALNSTKKLMQPGYESFNPPAGYAQSRKKFFQPLAMDLDALPNRLNQIIHDSAMRPSVENFHKIITDSRIAAVVKTHAGVDTHKMMVDYIAGVANKANTGVQLWKDGVTVSNFMRQNIMAGLVGFNPGTMLKHGFTAGGLSIKEVGARPFLDAVRSLHSVNDETGESNYQFAMRNSLELQRRDRNYDETLLGANDQLQPVRDLRLGGLNVGLATNKFMDYRQKLLELSSKPLAFSDKLSSVPTWLAAYDKALGEGRSHGDAVFAGDRSVRRAHGSTAITSRPQIMNQVGPWLSTFYNFFNDVFNRQAETLWRAGEVKGLVQSGQKAEALKQAGLVASGIFAYSIWPAVVESWVSPQESDPKDGWAKRAGKSMAYTEGSTLPVVRDLTNALLGGKDPNVGLLSTMYKSGADIFRDFQKKDAMSPNHAEKMIRDSGELLAVLTGLPEQIARDASFAFGLAKGTERPKGPWGYLVGARYGTDRGHSQTAGQYLSGQYDRRR